MRRFLFSSSLEFESKFLVAKLKTRNQELETRNEPLLERLLQEPLKRRDDMPGVAHVEIFANHRGITLAHTGDGPKHDVAGRRLR